MAHITPPIGLALYLASQIAGIRFTQAAKAVVPFVICEMFALMIITYFPGFTLFFVNLLT